MQFRRNWLQPQFFLGSTEAQEAAPKNTSCIISNPIDRIIVCVYRLHSPAVEILMEPDHGWMRSRWAELFPDGEHLLAGKQNLQFREFLKEKNDAWGCLETGDMSGSRPSWAGVEGKQQCSLHPWLRVKALDAEQVNILS